MPTLRPYQSEDVAAVIAAHRQHQCVLGRAATGLGKAVEIAALAQHYARAGRVLVIVDTVKLVRQLAETIEWWTGIAPGIEMGEQRAELAAMGIGSLWEVSKGQIVCATVQTLYSGDEGNERFRRFNPADFSAVLLDECETFFPTDSRSRSVVDWFKDGNPNCLIYGCTATPFRTDGTAAANLFTTVAFDRDILWGIDNGWLVPVKQAFVRVSADFSTLKVRKGDDGECDYSADDIAEKITNDATLIELAKGILNVCGDKKSIVVCPNVKSAVALSDYLCGERPGCAQVVYGEMEDDDKEQIMSAHRRGDFQLLVSVNMLCLDAETEILTESGWKRHDTITEDDRVANWDSGRVYFDHPKRIIRRQRMPWESMVSAVGRMVNIRVTDNHNLIAKSIGARGFKKKPAIEFVGKRLAIPASGYAPAKKIELPHPEPLSPRKLRRMVSYNSHMIRRSSGLALAESKAEALRRIQRRHSVRHANPHELSVDECRFIGFWVGDGSVTKINKGGLYYSVCQSTSYPKIIEWVDGVISRMGIDHKRYVMNPPSKQKAGDPPAILWGFGRGTGSGPQERRGVYRIEPYLKKDGSDLWWGFNEEQFDAFVEGLWMADGLHGDGTPIPRRQMIIGGTNRKLLDLIQAIACVRGYRTRLGRVATYDNPKWSDLYHLRLRKAQTYRITDTLLKIEPAWKSELVWCVETSSGNIITRRGGHVTVMGNCKGYDDPSVQCVVNCRKTRSKRLYQQILGRGTRPLKGLLDDLGDGTTEQRKARIAASDKPHMLMVNMVGVDDDVRDVTVVDILGTASSEEVARRAKEIMEEDEEATVDEAVDRAEAEIAEELEAEQLLAEAEAERADELDEERLFRRSVRVERANVDVEWQDDLRVGGGVMVAPKIPAANRATEAQINYLVRLGVKRETAMTYSKRQAGAVINNLKARRRARA